MKSTNLTRKLIEAQIRENTGYETNLKNLDESKISDFTRVVTWSYKKPLKHTEESLLSTT